MLGQITTRSPSTCSSGMPEARTLCTRLTEKWIGPIRLLRHMEIDVLGPMVVREEGRELEVLAHLLRKATADTFRAFRIESSGTPDDAPAGFARSKTFDQSCAQMLPSRCAGIGPLAGTASPYLACSRVRTYACSD